MEKATPSTGQEDLLAGSLSPQSSKTQQGKLSGVLNCQMMLRPNTEVVPITTFALSHTKIFAHPCCSQLLSLHQVFPQKRKHESGITALGSGLPPLHAAGKPLLASVPPPGPKADRSLPPFPGVMGKKIPFAEDCVGISPHAS